MADPRDRSLVTRASSGGRRALRRVLPGRVAVLARNLRTAATADADLAAANVDLTRRLAIAESQAENVIRSLLRRHYGGAELPPPDLRLHVGARDTSFNFWSKGVTTSGIVLRTFGEVPVAPVLDWGCGSGRTRMFLRCYPAWNEHYRGTDVDEEAIAWMRSQGETGVTVCGDAPPLPYPDAHFGGLFSFSVLTHIPPAGHGDWYREVGRVLAPGAEAYLTMNGSSSFQGASAGARSRFDADGHVFVEVPGHYMHFSAVSEEYTRSVLPSQLEVVRYGPGEYGNMDTLLVRRRPD